MGAPFRGSAKDSVKGSLKDSFKGSLKDSFEGCVKDSFQGFLGGVPVRATVKASLKGLL